MPDLSEDPTIRQIMGRLDRQANEILALKGAIATLLAMSGVSTQNLNDYVQMASQRPGGFGDPNSVADTIKFFEEVITARSGRPGRAR